MKTISTPLTSEQKRRVIESIKEHQRFISKECSRRSDTRPEEMKHLLNTYIEQRDYLISLLN